MPDSKNREPSACQKDFFDKRKRHRMQFKRRRFFKNNYSPSKAGLKLSSFERLHIAFHAMKPPSSPFS